jgi:predicted glycoside hydrolase/deacetylase ChbG (UPF0249 family)
MTADDFGRSAANNWGVLAAYQAGVIDAASLMVAEPEAVEAVAIARRHPSLAVGLHLCLSDGVPASAPRDVPLLVGADGRFPPDERKLHSAVLRRAGRQQLRREIAAQFDAFFATGLTCDHIDVHRNGHMHPIVAFEVFRAAASRRVWAVRIPCDPAIERPRRPGDPFRWARIRMLRYIAAFHNLRWLDWVINRDWSDPARLVALIQALPAGTTELFFHPVVTDREHMFKADLSTLLDERLVVSLRDSRRRRTRPAE